MRLPPVNRGILVIGVVGLAASVLTGCEWIDNARAKGSGDSVLEMFQPPSPEQAVAWAVDPYDADKRYRGLLLIANAPFGGDTLYLRMYEEASSDGDPGVRAMAVRALGRHGGPEHAPIFLRTFADQDDLVRWETARALQRIYAPEAVPALIDHVGEQEPDPLVREASAIALGQYAESRVAQALFSALNDRKLSVNVAANRSLQILTGEALPPDAADWVRWYTQTAEPFANRGVYEYPVFHRDVEWWEHITPWSQVPNEVAGRPAGAPPAEGPRIDLGARGAESSAD
ncbi:MAG: HEAT repeat domain-containing protein [Phycisphaerales bacterium]